MKKIFLGLLLIALAAGPALAVDGGGKKKAKKKAKVENKKATCDPKDCCDPKNCDYSACPKTEKKCSTTTACKGKM